MSRIYENMTVFANENRPFGSSPHAAFPSAKRVQEPPRAVPNPVWINEIRRACTVEINRGGTGQPFSSALCSLWTEEGFRCAGKPADPSTSEH